MHRLDAFVVSSRELIRCENIFGVVVVDFQQPVEFPFFRFQRMKLLRHLHIELFILPYCDNYPKYVLTTDEFSGGNYEGIKTMHIADFLLSSEY